MKKSGSVSDLAPAAAKKAVSEGLASWRVAGNWEAAAAAFGRAVDQGGKDAAFAQAALQLLLAARLLVAAAQRPPVQAARLARFALSLPLEDEQKVPVAAFAVDANMAAKNYG